MPLEVVGGVYLEHVVFPADEVVYGSGGRAAAAIKSLDPDVRLTTFIGQNKKEAVEYHANTIWEVPLSGNPTPEMVSFSYYHGLSRPIIRPTRLPSPHDIAELRVSGISILQFGMLEGDAVVQGDRVVFDPQNPESPQAFDANGSTATELAYVLNRGEAIRLTGEPSLELAAAKLLSEKHVAVVLVKCGAAGARLYTRKGDFIVRAYETYRVWPIGSGDVFAALFAHYWATERRNALEAAELSSRGAAIYCETRELPLRRTVLEARDFSYQKIDPRREAKEALIYVAGPFFTMAQLWLVEEAREALESAGFRTFSPYHDVGVGEASDVVPKDIKGIRKANALLALCDGLDAGTLFEAGYAVRHGLPVVAFSERDDDEALKMLRGTACKVFGDFTSAIYHVQWDSLR